MGQTLLSHSFNGGELSELMSARPDQQRYQAGCKTLKNMICLPQGPATRRGGFKYLGASKDQTMSNNVRVVPFVFSSTQARTLEFSHNVIRVWKDDALVDSGGSPYEVTTTYTSDQIPFLRFAQSADVVYIASPDHPPRKLSRYADDNWTITDIAFIPDTEVPTGLNGTATVGTASTGKKQYKYVITAIDLADGEESTPSAEFSITTDLLSKSGGNYIDLTWSSNADTPLEYRVYKYEAGIYGYIGSTTGSPPATTFRDDNIEADTEDSPPSAENPFNSTDNYPGIVFFWQQRLGWAATNNEPFTVRMSPSAQFESLAASVPPADSDAIETTLAAVQANKIQWVEGDRVLAIGTSGNEWSMGKVDEVLTPSNPGFTKQGGKGSEDIPALATGDSLLFVQRGGDVVREFNYTYDSDKYESADASIISSHLLDGKKIAGWCYQLNPYSVVWVYFEDGTFAAMTYMREHQVIGWHQHETDGTIESMCCVPGQGYDQVFAVVKRNVNGTDKKFIERMGDYFIRQDEPEDAFFVDSGVTYEGVATTTLTAIAPHLVGETVKIWADGAEQTEQTVGAGGDVTLDIAASKVHLGLGFVSDLTPNRPEVLAADGTTLTRVYKVSKTIVRLYRSMGVKVGADEDEMEEVLKHDASDPFSPLYKTGDVEADVDTGWDEDWDFLIRADGPTPMTVLAVTYDAEIGDTI